MPLISGIPPVQLLVRDVLVTGLVLWRDAVDAGEAVRIVDT